MDRRAFIGGVASCLLAAQAQLSERVYRIGLLSEGPHPLSRPLVDALRELGWVEGRNLTFEPRSADREDQLRSLAAEVALRGRAGTSLASPLVSTTTRRWKS